MSAYWRVSDLEEAGLLVAGGPIVCPPQQPLHPDQMGFVGPPWLATPPWLAASSRDRLKSGTGRWEDGAAGEQ